MTASGTPSPTPTPAPKTSGTGTITGKVSKDDTTSPIAGARVFYNGGSTVTNSSGIYVLSNVPAGNSVTVSTAVSGYATTSKAVTVTAGATSTLNFSLLPSCVASATNPSVTICEPSANSVVLNPVHIIAQVTDSHTITYTQVWIDGTKKYQVQANLLNTYISMTTGVTHRITVQAIDNINQIFKQTVYVTVN